MNSSDAQQFIASLLKRSPRLHRLGRRILRAWEVMALVPILGPKSIGTWRVTRKYQMLSATQFGPAADIINHSTGGGAYTSFIRNRRWFLLLLRSTKQEGRAERS